MSTATDLLQAVNDGVFDVSTNPWGLHDAGYLQQSGGVYRLVLILRAQGDVTAEAQAADLDTSTASTTGASITALVSPADTNRQAAETSQADAETAQTAAEAAAEAARQAYPIRIRSYF